ncbi:MAG: GGDEF domain-containing protein [Chloroflexi bacterium]|jgi:EAL domain-containing protein (putative c-di-GMP-specific phosphodiesterase class I)/GGDEF domain-containing protein|nr:GGDEF domain-containing protein [Chloroflexota bacterium]
MAKKEDRLSLREDLFYTPVHIGVVWQILLILMLMIGSGLFVYATGGIKYVYSHTMYLSIILAAFFFNVPGGIVVGILAGLVLGPYMPLNVQTGEMQTTVNWLYRMGIFVIVGMTLGSMFSLVKKQVQEIQRLALFDRNTGLPNRSHLYLDLDRMAKEIETDTQYAIFVIQVDNHSRITRVLRLDEMNDLNTNVSARLKKVLGESESVYQLFPYLMCIVLQAEKGEEFCRSLADSIYQELQTPFEINGIPVFINVSIGIAVDNVKQLSPTFFLQKGSVAAQIASEREMKYWVYKEEEFDTARDSQVLLGDVQGGIEKHEFNLHYQPVINLSNGELKSVEALLRWNHHGQEMIPPMRFLPTLEHTSLLYSIHDWELEEAIEQLAGWDCYKGSLAINLSTRLLLDHSWIQKYEKLLQAFNIDPKRIVFEITETVIMKDVEKSSQALRRLKNMGSMIALDDFGTGYSSLEYIQMLPIDYMKIDQRFVKDVHSQPKNQKIVRTAISLAKSIEVETVAEGIESQEDYDWLAQAGCKYGQGYFMSKPMSAEDFLEWIKCQDSFISTAQV